jgi:hypothetical protein
VDSISLSHVKKAASAISGSRFARNLARSRNHAEFETEFRKCILEKAGTFTEGEIGAVVFVADTIFSENTDTVTQVMSAMRVYVALGLVE